MNREEVASIIRLRAANTLSGYKIFFDNQEPVQSIDAVWVRVSIIWGVETQIELGTQRNFRTTGMVVFSIFAPLKTGERQTLIVIDKIRDMFRGVTVNNVVFRDVETTFSGKSEGSWQDNVACRFHTDDMG